MVVDIVFWECWGVVDKDIDVFIIYIFFYGVLDYFCYFGDLFFEFMCQFCDKFYFRVGYVGSFSFREVVLLIIRQVVCGLCFDFGQQILRIEYIILLLEIYG